MSQSRERRLNDRLASTQIQRGDTLQLKTSDECAEALGLKGENRHHFLVIETLDHLPGQSRGTRDFWLMPIGGEDDVIEAPIFDPELDAPPVGVFRVRLSWADSETDDSGRPFCLVGIARRQFVVA